MIIKNNNHYASMQVCFVILHYLDAETTRECVNSILLSADIEDYKIIIVDNGSNNGSYEVLKKLFLDETKVDILYSEKNLGFSRGNNIGFTYAKENYNPKIIIVGNNDLIFYQKKFLSTLLEKEKKYHFDVAGPDIINNEQIHQNPFREELCSYKRIKQLTRNRKIMLALLKLKDALNIDDKYEWVENWYFSKGKRKKEKSIITKPCTDVVLHGSCIILGPKYIRKQSTAFPEYTFMYMEEDFLALRCIKEKYKTLYLPEIKVLHKEMISTKNSEKSNLKKNIFFFSECIKSSEIYMRLLREESEMKKRQKRQKSIL